MTDCLSCSCNSPAPNIQPEGIRVNKTVAIRTLNQNIWVKVSQPWEREWGLGGGDEEGWEGAGAIQVCLPFTWQMQREEVPAADLGDQVPTQSQRPDPPARWDALGPQPQETQNSVGRRVMTRESGAHFHLLSPQGYLTTGLLPPLQQNPSSNHFQKAPGSKQLQFSKQLCW